MPPNRPPNRPSNLQGGGPKADGPWPLWQAALYGAALAIGYGLYDLWRGPEVPDDLQPDAGLAYLTGLWLGRAVIFALFAVILAAARNYVVGRTGR